MAVTAADIRRVAATYLRPENSLPSSSPRRPRNDDAPRTSLRRFARGARRPPRRRTARASTRPRRRRRRRCGPPKLPPVPGGDAAQRRAAPARREPQAARPVACRWRAAPGRSYDPAGKEGLADMVAGLLTKGAGEPQRRAGRRRDRGRRRLASAPAPAPTSSPSAPTCCRPTRRSPSGCSADAVMRPTFPAPEVELLRTQTLSGLQLELSASRPALASRILRARSALRRQSVRAPRHAGVGRGHHARRPGPFQRLRLKPERRAARRRRRPDARHRARARHPGTRRLERAPPRGAAVPAPPARAEDRDPARPSPGLGAVEHRGRQHHVPPRRPARLRATVANRVLGGGASRGSSAFCASRRAGPTARIPTLPSRRESAPSTPTPRCAPKSPTRRSARC